MTSLTARRAMTKPRHIALWTLLILVLTVITAAVYGGYRWQQFKQEQGIEVFEVEGVRLSTRGLSVQRFGLTYQSPEDERLDLKAENVALSFSGGWKMLPLRSISIDHIELEWFSSPRQPDTDKNHDAALPSREDIEDWSRWLPREGTITLLELTAPCKAGRCSERAHLRWAHSGDQVLPAELTVKLARTTHSLEVLVKAYEQTSVTHADAQLKLDGVQRLTSQNQLSPDGSATFWRGALSMSELPEAPWLLEWLGEWLDYAPPPLPALPEQMRVGAGWALKVDTQSMNDGYPLATGELRLSANIPTPWPVVGIGQLQGKLDLTAHADQGTWLPTELTADLGLLPTSTLFEALPKQLRPSAINLKIAPAQASESTQMMPLTLQLAASGPSPFTLDTHLQLKTTAPYTVRAEQMKISLRNPAMTWPDVAIQGLDTNLRLSGQYAQNTLAVRLDQGSRLTLGSLTSGGDLSASAMLMEVGGLNVEAIITDGQLKGLAVKGKPALSIGALQHPALRSQGWRWNGTVSADLAQITFDGPLRNDAGLTAPTTMARNWASGSMRINATLPELFLRAGNPLAATFSDWPNVLDLNTGRLYGQAQVNIQTNGALAATGSLSAKGIGGIYDRTELNGLDAELSVVLQRDQLRLQIADLILREANPGFRFGPLRFNGEYTGPANDLALGRLTWSTAETRLLGGRLWLEPGTVDLVADSQRLTAHLRGLQLPLLLEAYPTEGLSGTGVIDGEMVVQRSEPGISIEQGTLNAREPGGALQFRSAQIQALGQSNPAMRLVTEALDDFHYDLLSSDIHYAADGTLNLGLKLHGRNPALEGGRPINFSIKLEEDIPALLTSLQLSDRVSETIQRRVQERLK